MLCGILCVIVANLIRSTANEMVDGFGNCQMTNETCEFYLEIEHKLTMMRDKDLVFPYEGKLYRYDVVNVTEADPVPLDEVISADGWEEPRLVAAVNGKVPGPPIIVYQGQTVIVHVKNKLKSQTATIHWHGLHQNGTPWMDGVPFVTQCPLHPGQIFTYKFKAEPKGTFWYHSHVGAQRSMGTFGAFIVREKKVLEMEEHILVINDWNHDWDSDLAHMKMIYGIYEGRKKISGTKSLDGAFFSLFKFHAGLVNGRGRYYDEKTGHHNGAPLEVFEVEQGKDYRFRVIAAGVLYPFRISVDNHPLKIVASDGYDLDLVEAESFIINPGERFDFVITANQTVSNYWIRALSLEIDKNHTAEAILRYKGASEQEPVTQQKNCTSSDLCIVINCPFLHYPSHEFSVCKTFNDLKAASSDNSTDPIEPGKFQEFFLNFAFPGTTFTPGSVNGREFKVPSVSVMTQPNEWNYPCKEPECGEQKICTCTHALDIANGDTVQMVLTNMGKGRGWSHPVHLHGHSFHVVKMGYANYNETTGKFIGDNLDVDCRGDTVRDDSFCNNATWSNVSWNDGNVPNLELEHAPRKDTIIVPTGGYTVIRFQADNPGLWYFHCHIELHNLDGMVLMINESFAEVPDPPANFPQCHNFPPGYISEIKDMTHEHQDVQ
ncbi:hypothetical protein CHS0354_002467 [Potamilus streckersoni]|uniref:Laccase n=1 Tax=Potamilus streckersoni TaxID=2493646 RepID=A0AAE0T9L8_9BIVA|nr:hypothetical protein CHS0354_002467 [Potamilus streckersoni]